MLTDDQIAAFHRDGYLVVEDVVSDKLPAVRVEYEGLLDRLCATWGVRGVDFEDKIIRAYMEGFEWFQPLDISLPGDRIFADTPMHHGPAVFDMITAPRLLDLVQDLIGPEITSNPIQHVRIKPPSPALAYDEVRAHITATEWHQDRAVALEEADQTDMVTVWIAVTDATEKNGCLQVIPFGENPEILPHCPNSQTSIAEGYIDGDAAVSLPVKAGDVVLLHPLLPHRSLSNNSNGIRWSFDLRYNRTGQPTGRAHFPQFVARSAADASRELHDWREWRGLWEDARKRLAVAPHIDLHRWRSDAPYCA